MNIFKRIKVYFLWFRKSTKKTAKEYHDEMESIERYAAWRKSPYKVPWYPWCFACVAPRNYGKYEKSN